jgi:hypothetical protein
MGETPLGKNTSDDFRGQLPKIGAVKRAADRMYGIGESAEKLEL